MSVNRSFNLGAKHDALLVALAKESGRSLTETLRRALDALAETDRGATIKPSDRD